VALGQLLCSPPGWSAVCLSGTGPDGAWPSSRSFLVRGGVLVACEFVGATR